MKDSLLWEGNRALGKHGFPTVRGCQVPSPCQSPAPLIPTLTSIKQLLDSAVVIGKDSVMQGCAALEAGAVVQPIVEVIFSGNQDWETGTQTLLLATNEPPVPPSFSWHFNFLPHSSTYLLNI